jgi:hypothetical protein
MNRTFGSKLVWVIDGLALIAWWIYKRQKDTKEKNIKSSTQLLLTDK